MGGTFPRSRRSQCESFRQGDEVSNFLHGPQPSPPAILRRDHSRIVGRAIEGEQERRAERCAEGKHSLNLYLLITSFPLRHCTADHAASYLLGGAACSASTWMTSCVASLADKKKVCPLQTMSWRATRIHHCPI